MSVFGGDSWGREAQQRKRRVDDLMLETNLPDSCSYRKLSNGKYACTICPNNPVLDSSLTLSMHIKGSRHVAMESRHRAKELMQQEEMNKRIALSDRYVGAASGSCTSDRKYDKVKGKPLIEWTRKVASEALKNQVPEHNAVNRHHGTKESNDTSSRQVGNAFDSPMYSCDPTRRTELVAEANSVTFGGDAARSNEWVSEAACKMLVEHQLELRERREKELKFIAAGWKRDCHGKWFKDETVEFDSDEEDPNISLP